MRSLITEIESFDLKQPFTISTGSINCLVVLKVEIRDGPHNGRGECVPSGANMVSAEIGRAFAEKARNQISGIRNEIESGATQQDLMALLPRGPARNAVDCALWDLKAKATGLSIAELLGVRPPGVLTTAISIPLSDPSTMGKQAKALEDRALLKLKLGGPRDVACVASVRRSAPNAAIIVDVNGGWTVEQTESMASELEAFGVKIIEQPVEAGNDEALLEISSCIPLCADESFHDSADFDFVRDRYNYVNIKLDKCGGLTEALTMVKEARKLGMGLMVGCMAGTSLSMAPAAYVGISCEIVDLDGPVLLKCDRKNGLKYDGGHVDMNRRDIWG